MDPEQVFCPNLACPTRGCRRAGNIRIHSRQEQRYVCRECGQTFVATQGTALYRLRQKTEVVVTVLAYGGPVAAVVAAFGLDERTVYRWQARAGPPAQRVHEHLVQRPRDLGPVQMDELRVRKQGGVVWLASALQVGTRLWLGGEVSAQRDRHLIEPLGQQVRACALCRPLLFCTDGPCTYVQTLRDPFREPVPTGRLGRPPLRPWDGIAQVVKQYAQRRGVSIRRRIVPGPAHQVAARLGASQAGGSINTAFIERLNATFRARLAALVRKDRSLARPAASLSQGMFLIGTVYNFCAYHHSLRRPGVIGGHKWLPRTPAMAAGIPDHRWTVLELLTFRVPPPPWSPPRRRGRPSNLDKLRLAKYAAFHGSRE